MKILVFGNMLVVNPDFDNYLVLVGFGARRMVGS